MITDISPPKTGQPHLKVIDITQATIVRQLCDKQTGSDFDLWRPKKNKKRQTRHYSNHERRSSSHTVFPFLLKRDTSLSRWRTEAKNRLASDHLS
jgi:hypothetical protein